MPRRPTSMPTRIFRAFGWIFGSIGVVLLVVAAVIVVLNARFANDSLTAVGTVDELVVRSESCDEDGGDCQPLYAPRITFVTDNGSPFTFTARRASSPAEYQVGNTVTVRYQPGDLTTARIDSARTVWTPVAIVGGIGVVFVAFAVVWLVIGRASRDAFTADVFQPGYEPGRAEPPTDPEPPEGYR